jgi:predicted membrane channel-forming protein YqfA (hemolysin III family)
MFGFMPLLIAIIFDEMDRLYSLYFMVVLTLLMVGTVIVYMQSSNQQKRVSALVIGIFLIMTIAVSGPAWFWFNQMKATFWPVVIAGIIFYLVMFSPALIGIFHKPVQTI